MNVQRIQTETGSHIEPPLKQWWSPLKKLQWHAAVVQVDSGIEFEVIPSRLLFDGNPLFGQFSIRYHNGEHSAGNYREAWSFLNGMSLGARLGARK